MKIARIMVMMGLFLLAAFTVSAQTPTNQDACLAKEGLWDDTTSKCDVKSGFEIDINYPLLITQYPFAEQTIDSFISNYKSQFAQSYTPVDNAGSATNFWTLMMDYQEFLRGQNIITLLFTTSTFTGGAHPNTDLQSFTFDVVQSKQITLDDLFVKGSNPWPTIGAFVQQALETHLAEAYNAPLTDDDKQWIKSGAGEDPQNYQVFALDGDSLVFYFPAYQVAPYVAGAQSVAIPLSNLSSYIDTSVVGA